MDIENRLSELTALLEATKLGGGPERIKTQHEKGKMTARERIDVLLDEGSFVEIDAFTTSDVANLKADARNIGEGVVTGYGTINGRLVYLFSQDFTVFGGALGELHSRKICKVMDLAMKNGAPFIGLADSGGARIQEGVGSLSGYGDIFYRNTLASGVIPQISVIMGPSAGGAVYSPAITDFIFMVDKTSQMFITGPQVIKAITGEEVSSERLGGALTHNQTSGVAHFMGYSEKETLGMVRHLLTFFPQNNLEEPPLVEAVPPIEADADALLRIIPNEPNKQYDVKEILKLIVDGGEIYEVQQEFAKNAVICFARFEGMSVGIIANQPAHLAGCLDINASDKISRFVRFCDCFNIPLITFVDVPGFLPGTDQEYGGIIRHGAKILFAYSEATVPKITVILRKAYGGAYVGMCSRSLGADIAVAWPTAEIAVMGPDGAANIIFRDEIKNAEDPKAMLKQKIDEYREKFANPYIASAKGLVDSVIDPRETRKVIIQNLKMLTNKRESRPRKKHGNIPF